MADFEVNRLNKFGIGIAVMAVGCVALIWYTNPELITSWFKKTEVNGKIVWQNGPPPKVIIYNATDIEWKDVKVTFNKSSVSQRYEYSTKSIKKHPQGFHINAELFKKTNGEKYDVNAGAPFSVTVEMTIPDKEGKDTPGILELKIGDKKI
ncbi:MAG: hypothetical protein FWE67_08555 [Planctomycetaceae bacterium]|nr:hypothetical protein [Planctomycetaceae bacterium]